MEDLEEVVEVASAYLDNLFHAGVGDQMEEYLNAVQSMVTNYENVVKTEFL